MKKFYIFVYLLFIFLISNCSNTQVGISPVVTPTMIGIAKGMVEATLPILPENKTIKESNPPKLYISDSIKNQISLGITNAFEIVNNSETSDCQITIGNPDLVLGEKIFALVGSFATVEDDFNVETIKNIFIGATSNQGSDKKLIFTPSTVEFLKNNFQFPNKTKILSNDESLSEFLFNNPDYLSFVSFDQLTPDLKVLSINGVSPYDQDFISSDYYLTIPIGITCNEKTFLDKDIIYSSRIFSNRDPNKFTSVLLTGTTALVRATGAKMEKNGIDYPGKFVKVWFGAADISHISNESSFWKDCPSADAAQKDTFFCSRPEYVGLLTYLGVDVVELTGNHLIDKGVGPLLETFQILSENGIKFYAAGRNQTEAEMPAKFEHNGNKIVFLGCNEAGPTFVWLQDYRPGVLQCDFDRMSNLVAQYAQEGYLPIVTYQYWESFQFDAMPYQKKHSYLLIDAGAVIVSGSQSHLPMSMEIYHGGFIHYGLGNLFFDQMDIPVVGTRREFLDRHIFYDGKYLGTQLLTAILEDYSQPHPMTVNDRKKLLEDAFEFYNYQP